MPVRCPEGDGFVCDAEERKTRPRHRTGRFSASVIAEGMINVSSTTAPSGSAFSA